MHIGTLHGLESNWQEGPQSDEFQKESHFGTKCQYPIINLMAFNKFLQRVQFFDTNTDDVSAAMLNW